MKKEDRLTQEDIQNAAISLESGLRIYYEKDKYLKIDPNGEHPADTLFRLGKYAWERLTGLCFDEVNQ